MAMGVDRVEYMKTERSDGEEGVQIVFTFDDNSIDTFTLFGEDKEVALVMLNAPGDPGTLMLNLRHLLRLTVH